MSPQTRSQQGLSKESGAVGMGGEGGGGDRKGREREGGAKQGLKPRGSLSQDLRTSAQLSREWKTALRLGCLDLSLTPRVRARAQQPNPAGLPPPPRPSPGLRARREERAAEGRTPPGAQAGSAGRAGPRAAWAGLLSKARLCRPPPRPYL